MAEGLCGARPWVCVTTTAAALLLGAAPLRAEDAAPLPEAPPVAAAPEAVPPAAAPTENTAAAPAAGGERPVEQRVKELEETVRQLQAELARLRTQSEKPVDPKQVEKVVDDRLKKQKPAAGWNNGFFIQSEDGDFKLRFRTQVQVDSRAFTSSKGHTGLDNLYVRRARPIIEGTVYKNFDFRIMPDFGDARVQLFDAYLDYNYKPELKLRFGKAKEPFSLERLQGAPDLQFVERSISNNLGTNRDIGTQVFGDLWHERLTYQLGVFNGVTDGGSVDGDAGNDKDFVGRIFAQPFHNQPKSPLQGLGVGVAATIGSRDETSSTVNSRTAGRSTFFRYANGVAGNGEVLRLAPQLYYYHGPFGLMGEFISSKQDLVRGTTEGTVTNRGGFAQASYVLTGEKATFRTVVPNKPFDPSKNQWGAFELALRYSQIDLDDDNFRLGFADRANAVSNAHAWTVGLNWYLNRVFKVQLNYERADFDHAIQFGTLRLDHEDVFLSRFQVAF